MKIESVSPFMSFSSSLYYALLILSSYALVSSSDSLTHSIRPNFTVSFLNFIDQAGSFLLSSNGTFKATISAPNNQQLRQYYFSLIHSQSDIIIWTANVDKPISDSALLSVTVDGIVITDESSRVVWSTPKLDSRVSLMELRESGNLVLLDERNVSLWESFEHPTNTLVENQRLPVGKFLEGFAAEDELSVGDYRLVVTSGDAILQWKGMTYWKLSMEARAFMNSNAPVSFLTINGSGLYLLGGDGSTLLNMQVMLEGSDIRIAKLSSDGRFSLNSFQSNKSWEQELQFPADKCKIPFTCGRIGLCSNALCSCPPAFHNNKDGCVPINTTFSLPGACNASENVKESNSQTSYLKIGDTLDYFATDFSEPLERGVNLSFCQDLCSRNCSCLGVFHSNSSGSCYPIQNYVGSIILATPGNGDSSSYFSGYIKAVTVPSRVKNIKGRNFPVVALVLIPLSGLLLLIILIGFLWRRRNKLSRTRVVQLGSRKSYSSDIEMESIPGLPVRFDYEELVTATENFKTQIGSGGFGIVYRGTLRNKSIVAVKKMNNLGVEGKKDFFTEIAIIGNIHHVNLVNLKGFCAEGKRRLLVYEYMNRGSLDRALFGNGPVLEWKERMEIALGTARALAYLHSGCEHKIIHCDVKPENILLHGNLHVKVSDFGLSKLLSPEQSCLFTRLRGTRGYLAPEWLTSAGISDKSDVYSYGMVLLEIVRGRRNCLLETWNHGSGGVSKRIYFPLLALEMHEKRSYLELADPRLDGKVTSEEIEKLVRVALCCLQGEPVLRPTMSNVVGMLEGTLPLGDPRAESLNFLRFYGRRLAETSSTTEGFSEPNQFILNDHVSAANSPNNGLYNSLAFLSSQQISGPR